MSLTYVTLSLWLRLDDPWSKQVHVCDIRFRTLTVGLLQNVRPTQKLVLIVDPLFVF